MWLLGSFGVLSLLYRANPPTTSASTTNATGSPAVGEQGGKRERARLAFTALLAAGD